MASSLLLLLGAAALAATTAVVPAKTSAEKRDAFRRLLVDVEKTGQASVIMGSLADYLGVEDPTPCRVRNPPAGNDGALRSIYVCPAHVFYLTRRGPPKREEKRFLRLTRMGKLEQIVIWTETLDSEGRARVDGPSIQGVDIGSRQAQAWLKQENEFYLGKEEAP